ncbi:hypothetical protein SAY86_008715 [Trapa natans]|uniref:IMS import disulfide relay-system CHCH-CHCH-like Cx9C domain-containing protein n=1 Tax=Trapa natans TaxID=22666 RepID=A0AAN7QBF7_TRANT|nr:hypothetical protein SAY86_008715 [Trapa natans]
MENSSGCLHIQTRWNLLASNVFIFLMVASSPTCIWKLNGFVCHELTELMSMLELSLVLSVPVLAIVLGGKSDCYCLSDAVLSNRMGRKAGGIYINPKKFGSLSKPCMKEMVSFLNCLALNRNDDGKCIRQKDLLNACMDAQSRNSRTAWGSINYHLQRLSRGKK